MLLGVVLCGVWGCWLRGLSWFWMRHVSGVAVALLGVVLVGGLMKAQSDVWTQTAVVIEKKVAVKSGPSKTLATVFFIHEGVDCKVLKQLEGWVEVRFENGFVGWVLRSSLLEIGGSH